MPNVVGRADADAARSLAEFNVSRSATRAPNHAAASSRRLHRGRRCCLVTQCHCRYPPAPTRRRWRPPRRTRPQWPTSGRIGRGRRGRRARLPRRAGGQRCSRVGVNCRCSADAPMAVPPAGGGGRRRDHFDVTRPPVTTTVDILLEEETAEPNELVDDLPVEPPSLEPQEKDVGSSDEQRKTSGFVRARRRESCRAMAISSQPDDRLEAPRRKWLRLR